jgi:hypothetical protein
MSGHSNAVNQSQARLRAELAVVTVAEAMKKIAEACESNKEKINDTDDDFNTKRRQHEKKMNVAKLQTKFYADKKSYAPKDLSKLTELLKRAKACRTWARKQLGEEVNIRPQYIEPAQQQHKQQNKRKRQRQGGTDREHTQVQPPVAPAPATPLLGSTTPPPSKSPPRAHLSHVRFIPTQPRLLRPESHRSS